MIMNDTIHDTLKDQFREIYDPELGISIVDLGLIRHIEVQADGNMEIDMTLTSPACPIGPELIQKVKDTGNKMAGIHNVNVHMTFSPPWNPDLDPTNDGKFQLSMLRYAY